MGNKYSKEVEYYKKLNTLYIYCNETQKINNQDSAFISVVTIPTKGEYSYHNEIVMVINSSLNSNLHTEKEIIEDKNRIKQELEEEIFKGIIPQEEIEKLEYNRFPGTITRILSTMSYSNTDYVSSLLTKFTMDNIPVIPKTDVLLEETLDKIENNKIK